MATHQFPAEGGLIPPVSNGQQKLNFENLNDAAKQCVGGQPIQSVTISGGNVTPEWWSLAVDTEGAAASDDLDHVLLTNYPEQGRLLLISAANTARTVVVQHAAGGSGQFLLHGAADFSLEDTDKCLLAQLRGTSWVEVGRFYGSDGAAFRAFFGFGTASTVNTGTSAGNVPLVSNILGKSTIYVPAAGVEPQTTNGCGALEKAEIVAGQPEFFKRDFLDGAASFGFYGVKMPKNWDNGAVQFRVFWASLATDTDGVAWTFAGVSRADNEAVAAAYGTAVTVVDNAQGASLRMYVSAFSADVTISGAGANKLTYIQVGRNPADAGDTHAEAAVLIGVEMTYTVNALNDN